MTPFLIGGLAITRYNLTPESGEVECYTPDLRKWTYRVAWDGLHWQVMAIHHETLVPDLRDTLPRHSRACRAGRAADG